MTLNQIPHARVRIGEFKYPGEEEGLQAIHVFNYINFTSVTDQLLLERFFDGDGSNTQNENEPVAFGAFRDIGVQVFDWFDWLGWEHTYAAMVGNGNGLDRTDNNNNKDYYLYWASEKVFDNSTGPRRQGWKLLAWYEKANVPWSTSTGAESRTLTASAGVSVQRIVRASGAVRPNMSTPRAWC